MKASDYARTASEREDAGAQLIRTEQTNAVNTGIVGSADKSAMALKRAAYEKGRRSSAGGAAAAAAAGKRAKAGKEAAGSGGESGSTFGKEQAASQKTRTQADHHLRESLKKAAKPAARDALIGGVVSKTLEDSELEGMDDAAYRGRRAVRIARRLHRHFSGRDALEKEAPLGSLSEKKYRKKPVDAAEVQRKAQAAGYLRREMYTATDATQKAAASAGGSAVKRALPAAAGTQGKGLVALLGGAAVPAIFGLLLAVVLVAVLAGSDNPSSQVDSFGDLSGTQLEVAQALAAEGLGKPQIAAIMGNISGESGWDPTNEYHGEGNSYAYEYGFGLYQFTDTTPGHGEYTSFVNWCSANGLDKNSASAQTKYFIENLRASWATGLHRSGYYTKYITEYAGRDASYDAWLKTDDVGFATYCVMACWLRPADWAARQSFYRDRLPAAQAFYEKLSSGGGSGEEYAASDATQRSIVDAAYRTPSPGAGWCAAWVSNVYAKAGLGGISGNACDMYAAYCHSTDRSQLRVGMLVAVRSSSSGSTAGATYGHVGIYIGDNKIIHNTGSIEVWDLDRWISTYCKWSPAGWGFPPNVG